MKNYNYVAFYNGKQTTIQAESIYSAKLAAVQYFKPPKSKQHMVSVVLADVPVNTTTL